MVISPSKRLLSVPVSSVRKLTPYAQEAKKQGAKIYHLNIGDPDIETPEAMLDVLKNWNLNPIRYAQSSGEPVFLSALASYYHKLGFTNISEKNIIATVGGSEAVIMSLFATCEKGEEVLVFEPFYSNYASCAAFVGVKLVPIPTSIKNGFHLPSKTKIEQAITQKARAILFCSPGNPTGTVYTQKEIELLVGIAKKHNLFLISDEVYREYVFDGVEHVSLLSYIEQIPGNAIILDSLSKRYSLCGARLGAIISKNEQILKGCTVLAQSRLSGGIIDQMMGAALTKVPDSYINRVQKEYQKRRDVLYEGLLLIKGVYLAKPEGAFYAMVSLPVKNAEDFCIYLLKDFRVNNETVMLAPGSGFYATPDTGKNQVRIAYVLNIKDLKRSVEIIKKGLTAFLTNF